MAQVDLLRSLPKSRRNVSARAAAKSPEMIAVIREFGEVYFDGPREYGRSEEHTSELQSH